MPKPSDPITLPAVILRALDLSPEDSIRGNVAARAYNLAYGSSSDPFAGINLGWADQSDSTDFLVYLVDAVAEAITEGDDLDEFDTGEAADAAVPYGTRQAVMVALDLDAEVDDIGLLPSEPNMGNIAQVAFYCTGSAIIGCLITAVLSDDYDDEAE